MCALGEDAVTHWVTIALAAPAYSSLADPLVYRTEQPVRAGALVRVPLGAREVLGIVWAVSVPPPGPELAERTRAIAGILEGIAPLSDAWRALVEFAAHYYQRALGEVALAALPPQLRTLTAQQVARRLARGRPEAAGNAPEAAAHGLVPLTDEQARALDCIDHDAGPFLLFGVTGSGKTEVYMRAAAKVLERIPEAQVLVLVPEINLTPQLEARFVARFGASAVTSLHSGLTPAQRLKSWLRAHAGSARIVLGTRVAVFASMPGLALIAVDEEHDPSYKQQEGARYSARDLAVYRGRAGAAKVILGSATPSLESWHASAPAAEGGRGRYERLTLSRRVGASESDAGLPAVRCIDMSRQPKGAMLAPPLLAALERCVGAGQQVLLLLNRRGWAPVLSCADCGWKSACPHCSAYCVFHRLDRTLRCHHCGFTQRVPRACPDCGNPDIGAIGRGTEQLEARLAGLLADVHRPDGGPVRIARIDADSTRHKGALESALTRVHAGEVDVLVGTQMIAKGHDFRRVALVAALEPDGGLFSSDFRAPERLFALLMQAAGRAGRDAGRGAAGQMWIQTHVPDHALYRALEAHDYPAFAARQLAERAQAGLPPWSHLALLRAEARTQEVAQGFLNAVSAQARRDLAHDAALRDAAARVTWYPAVPQMVQRVADVERAQLLLECRQRSALQRVLRACQPLLHAQRKAPAHRGVLRWAIDVDPLEL
jgi:primosomal protein N' (replication factor Y)